MQARQLLVMPQDGFVQAFNGLSKVMQQLADKGVIKRAAPQDAAAKA